MSEKPESYRKFRTKHCLYVWKGYGEVHVVDACERKRQILKEDGKMEPLTIPADENVYSWMDSYYAGNGYKRMRLLEDADKYQIHDF